MNRKYRCPNPAHEDSTPSAHAYSDHWWCYGCGARGKLSELGLKDGERLEVTYVEDLAATLDYIGTLPRKEIRGFQLPFNERGYYLVYPTNDYYKFRITGAESGSKYRGPSGHRKPWFKVPGSDQTRLILVEGEFNALSLAAIEPGAYVVSPGGAGDFFSKGAEKELQRAAIMERIDIVVDADAAGAQAAIETKARLVTLGCPDVRIHLVETDFNQIHTEQGKEALREEVKRMGLL